ncbi:MAG TPA: cupin domain-containing protein [Niabella sp.]|nr:cupin domain-containing protein [Niabella sp.]HOZ96460.1 cupin domain-containing protein [Niabella sp.]HQW13359.1 cupin domain-containing protein [Niabella sp.]HQX18601.1 cupin domain-containing protein [Niabella sp.]HRB06498.1 cupin domain-containing protein [Niabella sp.]
MPVLKYDESDCKMIRKGLTRKLVHLENLMTAVLDFTDGPWTEPEPPHAHIHEQTCYLASGEILFLCEEEEPIILKTGDLFYVASGKKHSIQLLSKEARLVDSFSPIREDFI